MCCGGQVKFLTAGRSPNTHFNLVYAEADNDFRVFLGDFEAFINTDWLLQDNVKVRAKAPKRG